MISKAARLFFFLLVLLYGTGVFAATAETGSILLFPMAIHADTPMDYLKQGLADLIDTQLSAKGYTVIRAEKEAGRSEALRQAAEGSHDALITGSLTFLGQNVSLSLWMIETATGNNRIAFSKIVPDKNQLFDAMTEFTARIDRKAAPVDPPMPAATDPLPHPATPAAQPVLSKGLASSPKYTTEITALAVGDVNGDGIRDIVFADRHQVFVQEVRNAVFGKTLPLKKMTFLKHLFVDIHDGNGNGIDEIIVTAVHGRNHQTASYVLEWDGSDYVIIAKGLSWFFRKGKRPDTGETALLGQEQHFANTYFSGAIRTMTWDADKSTYVADERCTLPEDADTTIFSYDTADIFNKGSLLTIAYTPSDHLRILDLQGEESWLSSERHGGSSKYIEPRQSADQERLYLPVRIMAGDFNGDGKNEIVTLSNKNATLKMFNNLRNFVEGHVICLEWKGLTFEPLWKTQTVSGYIPDFTITDLNHDGQSELIYAVLPKKASFLSRQTSSIVIQPLPRP